MNEPNQREEAIFEAALCLPPEQRGAYLDKACGDDAELRQSVEALLQAHAQTSGLLEHPPLGAPASLPASSTSDSLAGADAGAPSAGQSASTILLSLPVAEKPGDRIGRYKLLQQIGEGGCGVVYMAEQQEPVKRRVALKVIKPGMDTRQVLARFEAERQALALMDHPNIAKVLDAGATDTGRPFFVMELVRGVKITDFCDDPQNNLSTRQRLDLFIQICRAIQHAHQKGIIHRDIKPSNILVTLQEDGTPTPKIIDFGIAKATAGQTLTDKTLFTAFEQFIGTPAYMSPEQAAMTAVDIDTRSDIYSLGVLLYELLTGNTPFDPQRLFEAGLDEIRRIIREEEPQRPSTRLSTLNADEQTTVARRRQSDPPKLIHLVSGDLDWIVMKCLEKDRARRYDTANGLAMDLQRYLNSEPIVARPPSATYRFQKTLRRNRLAFTAAGAVVLALLLGIMASTWQAIRASRLRKKAEAAEQVAKSEALKSKQVARFLRDMLGSVGPSVALGRDTTLLREVLSNTEERLGKDLAKQPEVEAELQYTLGEVYWDLGDLEKAEALHRAALSMRTHLLGGKNAQVAESMRRLGHVLWRRGRLDEAEKMARDGVAIQRELFGSTNLAVARSLGDLCAILNTKNNLDEAEAIMREALGIKESLLGHENLEVADTMDDLAAILSRRGKAMHPSPEALAIRQRLLGDDNPQVVVASLRLQAAELENQGKLTEAEDTMHKYLTAQRKIFGDEHPEMAKSLNRLASLLKKERKLAESEATRRLALAMQRKLLGSESDEVAQTLSDLGTVLANENKLSEAEIAYRETLSVRRKLFGGDHPMAGNWLVNLGRTLESEGKFDEAKQLYLDFAAGNSVIAAEAQYNLAVMCERGRGARADLPEALKWYRRSAESGNRAAQCTLGEMYLYGNGIAKNEVEAVKLFRKAAEQGHGLAQKVLGDLYATGTGVPKDIVEAIKWYTQSAEGGSMFGQFSLARMYQHGQGVAKDPAKAAMWYQKSANQGHASARIALGKMYQLGEGVAKDENEAKKWFLSAAGTSSPQSLNDLAWTWATSPSAQERDGTNAVRFAEKAVAATDRKNAGFLDTLAAAYAEAGWFEKAVSAQKDAMALAGNEKTKQDFATRLTLYESKTPYREGQPNNEK